MTTHISLPHTTRLSFLIISGIAIIVVGGTTVIIRDHMPMPSFWFSPSQPSALASSSLTTYLVSKLSAFIPWWGNSSNSTANRNRNRRQELLEGGLVGEEDADTATEIMALRKALAEAQVKEEHNAGLLEALRDQVGILTKELEESRAARGPDVEVLMATIEELRAAAAVEDVVMPAAATTTTRVVGDVYSTALDRISQEDAVKLTIALNKEISRVARSVTRVFSESERPVPRLPSEEPPEEIKEANAAVAEVLGGRMVELLQQQQQEQDAPVQMALQVSMAAHAHWIISSWYIENPDEEHFLGEIYARIRESEEQTVSGRWRALTRTHLRRTMTDEPDLTLYMIDAFMNIILTAGWHNDAAALQDYLAENFAGPINRVIKAARKLNVAIGEEVASCDLEALYIPPDVVFDAGSMKVEGGGGEGDRRVLCTMDLGLVRAERRVGVVGEWEEAVLLKPSVVLQ